MAGGKGNIRPEDGKQFSKDYQPAQKWTEDKALELGKSLIDWLKQEDENIFFNRFLIIEQDLDDSILSYLCKKFTSFSELLEKAKRIQEIKLVEYGVFDKLNATMTKFVLTNNHGYRERADLTTNDKDIEQKSIPIILSDGRNYQDLLDELKPE